MAKTTKKTTTKRRVKKNVEHGQAHIQSSFIDNEALRVAAKANPLSHVKMKGKIEDSNSKKAED